MGDKRYKIGIIGAGTTGLASALYLDRSGHDVTVFEKFDRPKPLGSGLLLQPTGLACLANLGLDKKALRLGAPISHLKGHTINGWKVMDVAYENLSPRLFGLGIHRSALFHLLYDEVVKRKIKLVKDFEAISIKHKTKSPIIQNSLGDITNSFDLVIDASGMKSKVRDQFAEIKLNKKYPYGAVWGISTANQDFNYQHLHQRYDLAHTMIGVMPMGKASETDQKNSYAFFYSLKHENFDQWHNEPFDKWQRHVANLWPEAGKLATEFDDHSDLNRAIYHDIILKRFYNDRLIFMGDAAHNTSPQLGQGANLGLADALVFSKHLDTAPNLEDAIINYDKDRRNHVHFYQWASRWLTPFFQSDSLIAARLRDLFFNPFQKTPYINTLSIEVLSGVKTGLFSNIDPGNWHPEYSLKNK
ncbi:FAD-dependent oxidoreductase [Curvivirga aplysinae]|uniref:FAD-dependent oxidoreductase n=1 Tax=Curvivirga aplysinae TaxID=2529852 RepID=UPI0012BB91F6|nr:NAD(P)/FAD-dependent oxidoreductase [Curvivirga aplysinae]MTI10824.1 FAD-dependent monooxygenase [Curvivirga aplysinae]